MKYYVNTIEDIINITGKLLEHKKEFKFVKDGKKHKYLNSAFSFDIETSSFYKNKYETRYSIDTLPKKEQTKWKKQASMYEWSMCLYSCYENYDEEIVVIGRSWDIWFQLLKNLIAIFNLGIDKYMIIYVHNLAYEFGFISRLFEWDDIFAISNRRPIYARATCGIEFRCSYILSGYSLSTLANNLIHHKIEKLKGDLDYKLIRHSQTPLTEEEINYCENDVRIVNYYIDELIEEHKSIAKLPLTKTGFVRNYCRKKCLQSAIPENNYRYRHLMSEMIIQDMNEFHMLNEAFTGGFTHANAYESRDTNYNIGSWDFSSSYPAVMVANKFPMSKGEYINLESLEDFYKNINNYCCIFRIKFINIQAKEYFENYLSRHKCKIKGEYTENNGRIAFAQELETTITEIDFKILEKIYEWEYIEIGEFIRYKKNYLPTPFVKCILELYEQKTTLKGVIDKEAEYLSGKEKINSMFGMSVTNPLQDRYVYKNEMWSCEEQDEQEALEKYNNSKKRFTAYVWGIYVTAYARRNLWQGIYKMKQDYIYSDTDSLKVKNYNNYFEFINEYNKYNQEAMKLACKYHNLDYQKYIRPKTIKGVEKPLGDFDFEGVYDMFKTIGAKRYIYSENNELHITIAGVSKKEGCKYLMKKYETLEEVFKNFDDELIFPKGSTGKQILTYIDDKQNGIVTDYLGKKSRYLELSCIHMEEGSYELNLTQQYKDYLESIKQLEEIKGVETL